MLQLCLVALVLCLPLVLCPNLLFPLQSRFYTSTNICDPCISQFWKLIRPVPCIPSKRVDTWFVCLWMSTNRNILPSVLFCCHADSFDQRGRKSAVCSRQMLSFIFTSRARGTTVWAIAVPFALLLCLRLLGEQPVSAQGLRAGENRSFTNKANVLHSNPNTTVQIQKCNSY